MQHLSPPLVRIRDIHKRFGATRALGGVSLDLVGGDIVALMGANGAGKSTLVNILSGAIQADAGISAELATDARVPAAYLGGHAA